MAIFISTVEKCPIARQAVGVVEIAPEILGVFAGAVRDPDEWLVVLLGERQKGGLHVIVDDIYVPPKQERSKANCALKEELPDRITHRVVGALHSHNNMVASFSPVDRGKNGLNSTFPLSIVISTQYTESNPEYCLLGFAYEAEGRFTLPCGSLGVGKFTILPRGLEDWPFLTDPIVPVTEGTFDDIHDCSSWKESEDSTPYTLRRIARCGIEESEACTRKFAFGRDGRLILGELPKAYNPAPARWKRGVAALRPERATEMEDESILDWGLF